MNKLFIIGNGFDLAHGYPTSYQNFINWLWKNSIENPKEFKIFIEYSNHYLESIRFYNNNYNEDKNYFKIDCLYNLNKYGKIIYPKIRYRFDTDSIGSTYLYKFKNKFFESLSEERPEAKWSDIEAHFYKKLLSILNGNDKHYKNDIDLLNDDIEIIKKYFEKYLIENVEYKEVNNEMKFYKLLRYSPKYLTNKNEKDKKKYLEEFPLSEHKKIYEFDKKLIFAEENHNTFKDEKDIPYTLFLDFNYTKTIYNYIKDEMYRDNVKEINQMFGKMSIIKIHGSLTNIYDNNPINLGFGDEMDDNYKKLEKLNDNRFLKYIKSFMYSNNANYKRLLNWISNNDYQVHILGHSCGLSDRIMLNTIFEHTNCKSIKIHYYAIKDEQGNITYDDYTDRVQNISRHFNKKSLMREKIVPKTLCEPLDLL